MKIRILALVIVASFAVGCGDDKPKAGGINIKAPGVNINIDSDKGVDIKAPGTDVKVNPKDGVDVKAPGTDVKVKPKPPGTDVKLDPRDGVDVDFPKKKKVEPPLNH